MASFIGITGTGTGIGKTALAAATLLYGQSLGKRMAYCKPVQSGSSDLPGGKGQGGDAEWLSHKLGLPNQPGLINSGIPISGITYSVLARLKMAASPHLAAEAEGIKLSRDVLSRAIADLSTQHDWVVVEGAGGAAVPFSRQGWGIAHLNLPITWIVAAAPGLGTLHQTRTTLDWLREQKAKVAGFVFCSTENEPSALLEDNRQTLEELTDHPCLGVLPYLETWSDAKALSQGESRLWLSALKPGFSRLRDLA
jgi:dethiobiotin synthetase